MSGRRGQHYRRPAAAPGGGQQVHPGLTADDERRLREPYRFEHRGRWYVLPSLTSIRSGVIRVIRNMDEADAMYTMLEKVAPPDVLEALDDMDMLEIGMFMKGWQEHAGVSLGELLRSSKSSTSTPPRSSTTGDTASA